jgi:hypothetical protein
MEKKVYDFTSFINLSEAQIEDPSTIVIGDSQTPIIAAKSKIATLLGTEGSEKTLWKSGMGVKWLYDSLKRFPITPKIKNVILSIGTNGGFNPYDNISNLVDELRRVFPSANFYVVQGSWGWGGNKNISINKVKTYYDKFRSEGLRVVEPPIGEVKDPHNPSLPVYIKIANILDREIQGQGKLIRKERSGTIEKIISRPEDLYKYKVENDHWMAKRDDQSNWFEISGKDYKPVFQNSIDTLDSEYPNLRTQEAPKRA